MHSVERSSLKGFAPDGAGTEPRPDLPPQAPTISLPKGGGAIRGIGEKFATDPTRGTGSLTVPIAASPGRSGFAPQLALSYDSGSGNGPFGFGWSLSVQSITRKTDKGLPRYLDAGESDVFLLSGNEDLVPQAQEAVSDGFAIRRYRPRIEGSFARIERWTRLADGDVHWRSISGENVLSIYGSDARSRIADPGNPARVFSWLICETRDQHGNAIVYRYKPENGEGADTGAAHQRNRGAPADAARTANRYLKRILYGNRIPLLDAQGARPLRLDDAQIDAADWMFELVLDYGEHDPEAPTPDDAGGWTHRTDAFSSYRAGFEVRTARLCRRILMFHHFAEERDVGRDCLVRSTDFSWALPAVSDAAASRPYAFLASVMQTGYRRTDEGYARRSLPPLEFEYSQPEIRDSVQEIDSAALENLPAGVDGGAYQWLDLYGEGITGILAEQAQGWFYKRNASPAASRPVEFGPAEPVDPMPSCGLAGGRARFMDLSGDGRPDLVVLDGPAPGFHRQDDVTGWRPFQPFAARPVLDIDDPYLRFVDLDGDGHADILITGDDALSWHSSLGDGGYGPAARIALPPDEEKGPRLVFADGTESIYLADFSGDGLADLVRVRNGDVCYWPNLGYGRFGARIAMDDAPLFDEPDQFSQQRVRLADIDGSGTSDIIYLHRDGVRLYFNQSGNGWSGARHLRAFPQIDDAASIAVADLRGNDTACLVWSSPLPANGRRQMRFVELMGGRKPHLLVGYANNLGAQTRIHYAPSTRFYIEDRQAGRPWITRLPFPVHVVEKTETIDHVGRNRFVTRYAYHHGHFDSEEREFRGFGMVEQWDTEEIAALGATGPGVEGGDFEPTSHLPPVLTRTWFHTGVFLGRDRVSDFFAGSHGDGGRGEYFREPGRSDADAQLLLLADTVLPDGLTLAEQREACRSLKGSMLRQEVYALDGSDRQDIPYTVSEQNFTIRLVQPKGANRNAVFFTHPREALHFHYERDPTDPRVRHSLTLEVDSFGNVLKEAAIAYGRRAFVRVAQETGPATLAANPGLEALEPGDRRKQTELLATFAEQQVTNAIDLPDAYRVPVVCDERTLELSGYAPGGPEGRFRFSDLVEDDPAMPGRLRHVSGREIAYEDEPGSGRERRLIEHRRVLFRGDDLSDLLPLGRLDPLALAGETYRLAFTDGLVNKAFRGHAEEPPAGYKAMLVGKAGDRGGYLRSPALKEAGLFPPEDADDLWWAPSGRTHFSASPEDTPAAELAFARARFFLPCRYRDPFGQDAVVGFDDHHLLMTGTRDALGNRVAVEAADYRVLQPRRVRDANGNRTEVVFDTLGMVAGTAVMGKAAPAPAEGDSLDGFEPDLTQAGIEGFLDAARPQGEAQALLGDATTRIVCDVDAFRRTRAAYPQDPDRWQPCVLATLAREMHVGDAPPEGSRVQVGFSYLDGFGREIQRKVQAEPGPVAAGGDSVDPRWVGTGWTIFNNKGKPVRLFEPFFSATHGFEFGVKAGVGPVLFYDPVGRVVATLHPDNTYEKVVFDPWKQTTYDVNDTCAARNGQTGDPRSDADIEGYVAAYFGSLPVDAAHPWQTWHQQRLANALGPDARAAALKAAAHADTPSQAHFDALGRPFLTIASNRVVCPGHKLDGSEERFATRVELDIEGNPGAVIDAGGRVAMRYEHDMLGNRIHQLSMEAGARWMLADVAGNLLCAWDSRGHRSRTVYDALRRPVETYLREGTGAEIVVGRTVYGESRPDPEAGNLRGKVVELFDQAGVASSEAYDFKGNLLRNRRRLARAYDTMLDWSGDVPLDAESYVGSTWYDALDRTIQSLAPHVDNPGAAVNVVRPVYNEANLLERFHVWLEHEAEPTGLLDHAGATMQAVAGIDYNAKGQRERIDYGNGVSTTYDYDPLTFRLARLHTTRSADGAVLQDLAYTYDPAGNIVRIRDAAQQTVFFRNRRVDPDNAYTYDALYRLIEATGREHLGQTGAAAADGYNDGRRSRLAHPGDGNAMGAYIERYVYDAAGNFDEKQHIGSDPASPGWTRSFNFSEPSLIEPGKPSNRLSGSTVGSNNPVSEHYAYDAHGNMLGMPHLQAMQWDFRDQLRMTRRQAAGADDAEGAERQGETIWYAYDAAGERVRKVTETALGAVKAERIYLGGIEIYREPGAGLVRETLHVMDDRQRIALVETRTSGADRAPRQLQRYQLGNHLGSASLELDAAAQIISYEEYTPYGSTSYQAVRSATETPKRYRYTGKERDEETGLSYHGARYYAPWLGRWVATDPLWQENVMPANIATDEGEQEELDANLYAYVNGRVLVSIDVTGRSPTRVMSTTASRWKEAFERKIEISGKLYDRGGTTKGVKAEETLKKYGETEGFFVWQKPTGKTIWMLEKKEVPTGESKRYIYTKRGGWIDMVHFMFYAGRALINLEKYRERWDTIENRAKIYFRNKVLSEKTDFNSWLEAAATENALRATLREGVLQEDNDAGSKGTQKLSAYSYEDLPSDNFGVDFAINHFNKYSSQTLAEQIDSYLKKLGADEPQSAPNWEDVPEEFVSPHAPRNYSIEPMYKKDP